MDEIIKKLFDTFLEEIKKELNVVFERVDAPQAPTSPGKAGQWFFEDGRFGFYAPASKKYKGGWVAILASEGWELEEESSDIKN